MYQVDDPYDLLFLAKPGKARQVPGKSPAGYSKQTRDREMHRYALVAGDGNTEIEFVSVHRIT